jgi:hypothetical protein
MAAASSSGKLRVDANASAATIHERRSDAQRAPAPEPVRARREEERHDRVPEQREREQEPDALLREPYAAR